MNFSSQDRADLRKVLRAKINGKVTAFQDTDLNAMLEQGLRTASRLEAASWSELSEKESLPRVLVRVLMEAYNNSASPESGTPQKQAPLVNWSLQGSSKCFNMGDLIIAASQVADAQEGSVKYRGVSCCWTFKGQKWRARIHWLGKAVHLGYFAKEEDAAHMYDRAAICVRGSEAILNYPWHTYDNDDLPRGWLSSKDHLG